MLIELFILSPLLTGSTQASSAAESAVTAMPTECIEKLNEAKPSEVEGPPTQSRDEKAHRIYFEIDDPRNFEGDTIEAHFDDQGTPRVIIGSVDYPPRREWNPETRQMDVLNTLYLVASKGDERRVHLPIDASTQFFVRQDHTFDFQALGEYRNWTEFSFESDRESLLQDYPAVWMRWDREKKHMETTRLDIVEVPSLQYDPNSDRVILLGRFTGRTADGRLVAISADPGAAYPHIRLQIATNLERSTLAMSRNTFTLRVKKP